MAELEDREGAFVTTYSVKVSRYLSPYMQMGAAMHGQSVPHPYFHRSLMALLGAGLAAGFVLMVSKSAPSPKAIQAARARFLGAASSARSRRTPLAQGFDGPNRTMVPRLSVLAAQAAGRPHVFVAMPFAVEFQDVYDYAIQNGRPACERVDEDCLSTLLVPSAVPMLARPARQSFRAGSPQSAGSWSAETWYIGPTKMSTRDASRRCSTDLGDALCIGADRGLGYARCFSRAPRRHGRFQ